jgi:phosphoribosylanthranilate isomerase
VSVAVKICGLKTPEAVDAAVAGGAAYAGFVFFEKSPRVLTPAAARSLRDRLPGAVKAVALVVDPSDDALEAVIGVTAPDLIQLHGAESPARVAAIRARFGLPVIKALPVARKADLECVPAYAQTADMLLFDAKPALGDTRPGGNARAFDWALLQGIVPGRPWLLAGGLSAETLAAAVRASGARAVDVSSGVERTPGEKDPALIRAFLAAAQTL